MKTMIDLSKTNEIYVYLLNLVCNLVPSWNRLKSILISIHNCFSFVFFLFRCFSFRFFLFLKNTSFVYDCYKIVETLGIFSVFVTKQSEAMAKAKKNKKSVVVHRPWSACTLGNESRTIYVALCSALIRYSETFLHSMFYFTPTPNATHSTK